jgi:hypothetical protein
MNSPGRSDDGPIEEVLRARRFELVDGTGAVRAVLGELSTGGGAAFGLALVGVSGRPRVWIEVGDQGPALVFDRDGNAVLQLGVDDPAADALHVGAYLHLSDEQGRPALRWRVEDDGSATLRTAARGP